MITLIFFEIKHYLKNNINLQIKNKENYWFNYLIVHEYHNNLYKQENQVMLYVLEDYYHEEHPV